MNLSYKYLPFINKVKVNQEAFGNKIIKISNNLKISPNWLMITINNETAGTFSPSIKNPTSTATGLIQFMEATAKSLGTTTAALAKMSNVEQLDYVENYFKPYIGQMKSVSDVYLAVFFPAALDDVDTWVFPNWAAKANPIFDINKDGVLTKGEFKQYVNNKYSPYLGNDFEKNYVDNNSVKKK